MLHILICDDNQVSLTVLGTILQKQNGVKIHPFQSPLKALDYILNGGKADAAFLDILMPRMKGTELAARLRENGFDGCIIFLTASNEFAEESYAVKAFDYILKPVDPGRVADVVKSIKKLHSENDSSGINVTTKKMVRKITYNNLLYVEVNARQLFFHLTDGTTLSVYGTLKEYSGQLLKFERFAACHQSYIVNMDYIKTIEGREIIMENGDILPISKRRTAFKSDYYSRLEKQK